MGFKDVVVGGVNLIRQAIQSPGFVSGVKGWIIRQDGSAEFQNITARGTITGSTIKSGVIESSNWNQTSSPPTGFVLNGGTTTFTDGSNSVGPNQIEILSGFRVGKSGSNNITAIVPGSGQSSGQASWFFNTGLGVETTGGSIFCAPASGQPTLNVSSAITNNGFIEQVIQNPNTNAGVSTGGTISFVASSGVTPASNGLKGTFNVGGAATDVWTLQIQNEQSVINGGAVGFPGLVVGDVVTPRSQLLVSPNEIMSLSATSANQPIFLNENNTEAFFSSVAAKGQRAFGINNASQGVAVGTTFSDVFGNSIGLVVPQSGQVVVTVKVVVIGSAALVAADFIAGSIQIVNATTGTVFTPSDNRGAQVDGTWLNSTNNFTTMSFTLVPQGLGTPGQSLTITSQFHQGTAGRFTVGKLELCAWPNF